MHERVLVDAADLGRLVGRSRKMINEWNRAGLIPSPIMLGASVMWRRAEIDAWLASGCPARGERREGKVWEWKPGAVVRLEHYHRLLLDEGASLAEEAGRVADLIKRGEKLVHVTPKVRR